LKPTATFEILKKGGAGKYKKKEKSRVSEILNWKKTKSVFSQKSSHIHRVSKHNNFIKPKKRFFATTNVIFATKLV